MRKFIIILMLVLCVPASGGFFTRGGNGIRTSTTITRTVELSNANIKALSGTPKELVPAQGASTLIEFVSAVLVLDFSGGAFAETDAPDDLAVEYNNGTGTQIATWDTTAFITAGADFVEIVQGAALAGVASATNANKNIVLINTGADYTGAASTSTMTVLVTYRVHVLGL